ncbi:MAG: chorismate synthase [Firmicutes bacterium]|nr:chorismate synthase [Bacillota bacterium]
MSGSTYGNIFKITTWGESHGRGLGVVIDGCPAGIPLCEEDIQRDMDRRRPGQSRYTTQRSEADKIGIMSGVFDGKTTGTPISLMVLNTDQRSRDYSAICDVYRPGHADYGFEAKYGFRDYRGGGRSSARETLARVAAGAVARKILASLDISVDAYTVSVNGIEIDRNNFDLDERFNNPVVMPDKNAAQKAAELLDKAINSLDSVGGVIECRVGGLPAGIGEPVFDKLDASLGRAMFSIGAVKGVEFGLGFEAAKIYGSQNNDSFCAENGVIGKRTNNAGGILGGISDGSELILRAAFKPTPSIAQPQQTVNSKKENTQIEIKGRHDPIVVPRAVIVVEAMTAITLVDLLLMNMSARIDNVKKIYCSKQ